MAVPPRLPYKALVLNLLDTFGYRVPSNGIIHYNSTVKFAACVPLVVRILRVENLGYKETICLLEHQVFTDTSLERDDFMEKEPFCHSHLTLSDWLCRVKNL